MRIDAAVIKEQGITFAVVIVKSSAVSSNASINETQLGLSRYFPNMPIILCHQDSRGIPTYYGRKDIVNFLANILLEQIPWKTYTFSD